MHGQQNIKGSEHCLLFEESYSTALKNSAHALQYDKSVDFVQAKYCLEETNVNLIFRT
jgi:hypothetical protein